MSDWVITSEVPKQEKPESDWMMTSSMSEPQEKKPEKPAFSWPRFLSEKAAQGPLDLMDLVSALIGQHPMAQLAGNYSENPGLTHLPSERTPGYETVVPQPGTGIKELSKKAGLDLESQGQGNTPLQRTIGAAVKGATSSPFGLAAAATGAGASTLGQVLEEFGMSPLSAGLVSALTTAGVTMTPGIIRTIKGIRGNGLQGEEAKVIQTLRQQMSPEEYQRTIASLEENLINPHTTMDYQPMTAEVANSPTVAALHRNRYGIPESGLARQSGHQNEAIQGVFNPMMENASNSERISGAVNQELSQLKKVRHEATNPLYESVDKNITPVEPKLTKEYLKSRAHEKGGLKKEVEYVEKQIQPSKKSTPADTEYLKLYQASPASVQAKMTPPATGNPEAKELAAAYRELNSRQEGLIASGKKSKARIIKNAKKELHKDLEAIPEHAEAVSKYRELSKPINAVEKHATLKNVIQPGANKVVPQIFENTKKSSSADNVRALKNIIGENPKEWEGFRAATAEHMHNSITNAQAEGTANVISYDKLNKFLKNHKEALSEVYTSEQMRFVNDLERAINGQNIAKTLGEGPGSATAARTAVNDIMKQGFGLRAAEGVTRYTPVPKFLKEPFQFMINRWITNNQTKALGVLDRILLNPNDAHALMTHKFNSQPEFNAFMKKLTTTTTTAGTAVNKEKDNE